MLKPKKKTNNKDKMLLGMGITIFVLLLSIGISSADGNNGGGSGLKISNINTNAMSASPSTAISASPSTATITGVYFGKHSNLDTSSSPWNMKIQDTTLNLSDIANTPNFGVVLINFANLKTGGTVKTDWYDNKNKLVYTYSYTIPSSQWKWYSIWFGTPSNLNVGKYHIIITTPWGTKTQDFTILEDMHLSANGLQFIKMREGGMQYFVKGKFWMYNSGNDATIGFGHLVHYGKIDGRKSEDLYKNGITMQQALDLLASDVVIGETRLKSNVNTPLKQFQFDALVSICYNSGKLTNMPKSPLLTDLQKSNYAAAAIDIQSYKITANGKYNQGLVNRRALESKLFSTGDYGKLS